MVLHRTARMSEPLNIADLEALAADRLEPGAHGYFAGGAGDERTLRRNVEAFREWELWPRVLVDVSEVSTAIELMGAQLELPVLVAPVAFQKLAHPDGEVAMARAAEAAGTVMCLSTIATCGPTEVGAACAGRKWMQLYSFRDRGITRALLDEAAEAGFEAVLLTVDAPYAGKRERDFRTGFEVPADVTAPAVKQASGGRDLTVAEVFGLVDPALGWEDLAELVDASELPILVKGLVRADDAELAVEHGAAGVVVSNHGGRQLDGAPATIDALPEVVDAVGGRIPVLVDGGVRRGTDIAVALALGADAVLVGRACLWGLAWDGQAGAERALEILRDELAWRSLCSAAPRPRRSARPTCGVASLARSGAEREGFEPSRELLAPYSLSRRVPSAARPPLRANTGPIVGWLEMSGTEIDTPTPLPIPTPTEAYERYEADLRGRAGAVRLPRSRRRLVQRSRHAAPRPRQGDPDRQQVGSLPPGARAPARPRQRLSGGPQLHPARDAVAVGARAARPGPRLPDRRRRLPDPAGAAHRRAPRRGARGDGGFGRAPGPDRGVGGVVRGADPGGDRHRRLLVAARRHRQDRSQALAGEDRRAGRVAGSRDRAPRAGEAGRADGLRGPDRRGRRRGAGQGDRQSPHSRDADLPRPRTCASAAPRWSPPSPR